MRITLSVPIKNPDSFVDVEAEFLFDFAPHLASVATFAIHKGPNSWEWSVTNVETGLWVGKHHVRSEALREASEKLARQTPRKVMNAYRNAPKLYPVLAGQLK